MPLDLQSHRAQLVLTDLGASALTASLFAGYQQYSRHKRRQHLAQDVVRSLEEAAASSRRKGKQNATGHDGHEEEEIHLNGITSSRELPLEYSEELVREQLARNYAFFGEEGMARVRQSTVVIVGCGGVGSWAAVMLARSCVSFLHISSALI